MTRNAADSSASAETEPSSTNRYLPPVLLGFDGLRETARLFRRPQADPAGAFVYLIDDAIGGTVNPGDTVSER